MDQEIPAEETVEVEPAPENPYIATLDELIASSEATIKKENDDKIAIRQISNPNPMSLKTKLLEWASLGFPAAYEIISITLIPPTICSDGQIRSKFEYLSYLLGMELGPQLRIIEQKLPGMALSYSTPDNRIRIHVSKVPSS